ncbi:MAG TPA: hypothetical protein VNL94_00390 [Candidatus Binatia bacterium]|nr:hypothetical protein [Candidatus Binatia bacterium]
MPRTDRTRSVLAAIAALVGLVWTLQGAGLLPGSFMTGDPLWLVIGLALIAGAAASAFWPRRTRR